MPAAGDALVPWWQTSIFIGQKTFSNFGNTFLIDSRELLSLSYNWSEILLIEYM